MRSSTSQSIKKPKQVKIITASINEAEADNILQLLCDELEQARTILQKALASHAIYAKQINKKD